jgi:hypothetical protein
MGGFRPHGRGDHKKWVVLFSTGDDRDWPDSLDLSTGQFIYYGDNKKPGHELHDTAAGGNSLLRHVFAMAHGPKSLRQLVPPFFVFKKSPTETGRRSVQFRGLAVPGFTGIPATEDLVAVWKAAQGQRFQNYRAVFTILNIPEVTRLWVADLASGNPLTANAPQPWRDWIETGRYLALAAEPTTSIRSAEEQAPDTALKREVLNAVWSHFKEAPIAFEAFAAFLYQLTDQRVIIDELTRASADGGRDAIGRYVLGLRKDPVYAEFSLEAKCYRPSSLEQAGTTVGVREVSRLISRLRHRQFGVLVTTSIIARQAYEEVREDGHPIVFLSGGDIAEILIHNGYSNLSTVQSMLSANFPTSV